MPNQVNRFFRKLLDLREGAEEKSVIIENVKDDGDFSSARFWTLVFAIGVASVGLNINSTPVIIGAMLISPLMGPIVSMGLALSINDWGFDATVVSEFSYSNCHQYQYFRAVLLTIANLQCSI
jgi:hypothetical protein